MNTKKEVFLIQNSAQLFYFKLLYTLTNSIPLQFFTVTNTDGIYLWEYEKESEEYKSNQMIAFEQSGRHKRGEMNEEGIYVAAGSHSDNVKIYDMKYYNYPDLKIKLLQCFPHSDIVSECFFKNSVCAICCDWDDYIKEYDLSNPQFIPTPTLFYKTTDHSIVPSILETKDKKYIIAGGDQKLLFLNAEDGTLRYTLHYETGAGGYPFQIVEVRLNILVSADVLTAFLHDIQNIPTSVKLPDIGFYHSVIALESNPGDFAIGGRISGTNLGFVYIYHLEDNQTISTLKYVDNIPESVCGIRVIKELKRGTIIFGGNCAKMCLWNYAAIPQKDPLCWDDQTGSAIEDIVGVPY